MEPLLFWNFILATALGALIGTEREMPRHQDASKNRSGFGGIRSYGLLALFGALMTWIDMTLNTDIWKYIGFIGIGILIVAGYIYSSFIEHQMGVTSEFAGLVTYCIGVIIMSGNTLIAVIVSILVVTLLASKEYLEKWRDRFSRVELGNALKFGVVALVILPLLPDQRFSIVEILNWGASGSIDWSHPVLTMRFFNPYSIWLFVTIMAGVEYIGYILSKFMGKNSGIIASGAVGGMISSTATTAAMTNKSVSYPENSYAYATATLIASSIMCIRVVLISGFYSPKIISLIIIPAGIMFLGLVGSAYYFYTQAKKKSIRETPEKEEYKSPFDLISALQFAGIVVAIKFIAGIGLIYKTDLENWLGESADKIFYYVLGAVSGLADVDAITQDMASKSSESLLPVLIASSTILIAMISNNIVKASIAGRFGEKTFGRAVMIGFGVSIILGVIVIALVNIFS